MRNLIFQLFPESVAVFKALFCCGNSVAKVVPFRHGSMDALHEKCAVVLSEAC